MKRKRPNRAEAAAKKKQKIHAQLNERPSHALLKKYYPELVTLRQYLASRLPKKRRRRLQQYGRDAVSDCGCSGVVSLLDSTLIGCFKHVQVDDSSFLDDDISLFTQQVSESDAAASVTPGKFKQTEVRRAVLLLPTFIIFALQLTHSRSWTLWYGCCLGSRPTIYDHSISCAKIIRDMSSRTTMALGLR